MESCEERCAHSNINSFLSLFLLLFKGFPSVKRGSDRFQIGPNLLMSKIPISSQACESGISFLRGVRVCLSRLVPKSVKQFQKHQALFTRTAIAKEMAAAAIFELMFYFQIIPLNLFPEKYIPNIPSRNENYICLGRDSLFRIVYSKFIVGSSQILWLAYLKQYLCLSLCISIFQAFLNDPCNLKMIANIALCTRT